MPANFSPSAQAARLHAARQTSNPPFAGHSTPPQVPARPGAAAGERWCEWPRRAASNPPFTGIRQALLAIQQARHA